MKVEEFESRINELLDRRETLEGDPQLVGPARDCEDLRAILASYSMLLDGVTRLPMPVPSADLSDRIVAAMRKESVGGSAVVGEPAVLPFFRRPQWILGTAAAAVLALVVPLVWSWNASRTAKPIASSAGPARVIAPSPDRSSVVVGGIRTSADEPRRDVASSSRDLARYAEFARQTSSVLSDLTLLISELSADPRGFMERAKQGGEQETVIEQLTEGLKPFASSTSSAFDFLLEVLPPVEAERS